MNAAPPAPMELHRIEVGEGPAVLLLHGLGGDHTVWNGTLPALRSVRTIVPDLRGHGRSVPAPEGPIDFDAMEADLGALLDRAGVDRAHVVGLSAGAFLALRFALDRPERVRSLVSIAGAAHCDRHTREIGERWARTFRENGFDAYVLRLVKDLYSPDWTEGHLDIVDRIRSQAGEAEYAAIDRWAAAIRSFDIRSRIARISCPTLVLHGMEDQVVDVAHARVLRQTIPGATMRLFPRTGHLLPVERPQETGEAIAAWVVGPAGPSHPPA